MPFAKGQNPHHPAKGSSIKVEPIRSKTAIANIKKLLSDKPRDRCLFTLGINTAYRANELLSVRVGQVRHVEPGDTLELKQSKTAKYRMVTLNKAAAGVFRDYLSRVGEGMQDDEYLFASQRGAVLTVPTVSKLVKGWCAMAGLKGNYGSHTLRKSWGYWQYKRGTPLPLLVEAFGHATQRQTLAYLCIQPQEIQDIYDLEL